MRTNRIAVIATAAAIGISAAGCSAVKKILGQASAESLNVAARADLIDAQQHVIGRASFEPTPTGMLIRVALDKAPAGTHGIHLHAVGKCEPPGFESAGGHMNPFSRVHGFRATGGPHAGDLPNIVVPESGTVEVELMAKEVTLREGAAALLDADGSAIVLHAGPDDYRTDPAGGSGPRIACGIIRGS